MTQREMDEIDDLDRKLKIVNLQFERNSLFFRRFCYLTVGFMCLMMVSLILTMVSVFYRELEPVIHLLTDITRYIGMSIGFVFAELARRRTVNVEAEDLRPYTWLEIFRMPYR